MGAGASSGAGAGIKAGVSSASVDDLKGTFAALDAGDKAKMIEALSDGPPSEKPTLHYFAICG